MTTAEAFSLLHRAIFTGETLYGNKLVKECKRALEQLLFAVVQLSRVTDIYSAGFDGAIVDGDTAETVLLRHVPFMPGKQSWPTSADVERILLERRVPILKPCPMCGHEAHRVKTGHNISYVDCGNCGIRTMPYADDQAVEIWNARVNT